MDANVSELPERTSDPTPSAMRRILGNFGLLVRGRGVAALFVLAATVLTARTLGPADFGVVMLVHAYALVIRGLLNVQPFESVVRFGVPLLEIGDTPTLRRLLWLSLKVDLACATSAAALAIIVAPLAAWLFDWQQPVALTAMIYGAVLITTASGTATGLLRLFDRFDLLGRQLMIGPLVRLAGVLAAWALDTGVTGFVLAWALGYGAEHLFTIVCGWRLYGHRIGGRLRPDRSDGPQPRIPGVANFLWVTYWQSNLDLAGKQLPTLLAGALLGSVGAGLFRLAQQVASVLAKPAALIRQVVFLDQTRLHHRGDRDFGRITRLTALLAGASGALFVMLALVFGEPLLRVFVGEEFVAASGLLTVMLFASTLELASAPLRTAAYAIGKAGTLLRIHVATTSLYMVLFFALTSSMGLIGAGVAAASAALIALMGQIWLLNRQRIPAPSSPD